MSTVVKGDVFGRLTTIECVGTTTYHHKKWLCVCTCGIQKVVLSSNLVSGNTLSCGCLHKETISTCGNVQHTSLRGSYSGMMKRCYNPKHASYKYYGAKGVLVCGEWQDKAAFVVWAKENGWKEGLVLDRVDSSKGYSPDNCRWITRAENTRESSNRRWNKEHWV